MFRVLSRRRVDRVRKKHALPGYRTDIDGLRAVAILSVVLFHAFPPLLPGGFVGVDVFFVISGFLISGIIFKGLEQGSFDFVKFYVHRARRIFPALILVLAGVYVSGWLFLLPGEFSLLGKHIAAGAGFVQNFVLWTESGYFDTASELKPLLHLWSLAIEEQFYLAYPLMIWAAWRVGLNVLVLVILVGLASFGVNLNDISHDPVGAFFLPHARIWELLVGGAGAYIHLVGQTRSGGSSRLFGIAWTLPESLKAGRAGVILKNCVAAGGLMLILVSVFGLHKGIQFPGWRALLPVVGAVSLIMAGPDAWVNRKVLSNRWMVFIGLISYPLYLWHWPLLSFAHLVSGRSPAVEVRVALLLLALLLAWLTYVLVERPIRFGGGSQRWALALTGLLFLGGCLGAITFWQAGFPFRDVATRVEGYTSSVIRTSREKECFEIPYAYKRADGWNCVLGSKAVRPSMVAYGDSHALSLIPVLDQYGADQQMGIVFAGASGCPPFLGIQSLRGAVNMELHNCQKLNERIFDFVKSNGIERVLLVGRWTYYVGGLTKPEERNAISMDVTKEDSVEFARESFIFGLQKTVAEYRKIGVKVYLINDTPQQEVGPLKALKLAGLEVDRVNDFSISRLQHQKDQAWVRDRFAEIKNLDATFIDFDDFLCSPSGLCPIARNGKSLYFDGDHLSVYGAMSLYDGLRSGLGHY